MPSSLVDCDLEHQWEPVGSTDLGLNLALDAYPIEDWMWFVLYGADCTQLAVDAVSPQQALDDDFAVVGVPIATPTYEDWEAERRVVTCGMGVELASEATADPRLAEVNPLAGSGSLHAGTWVASDGWDPVRDSRFTPPPQWRT